MSDLEPPKGLNPDFFSEVNPPSSKSNISKYYEVLVDILKQDFSDIKIRRYFALVFVIVVGCLFAWILWESCHFLNDYLDNIKNELPVPPEKVVITILTVYTTKLAGLGGMLATYMFKGYPHQSVPKE